MKQKMIILMALVCVLCACGNPDSQNFTEADAKGENSDSAFEMVQAESQTIAEEETKITFEEANILSFELINRDNESYDEIIATYSVLNNGSVAVDYFSVDFAYLDKDGNKICDDGRYNDCQIDSGKSARMISYSYLDDEYSKSNINSIEVTSYDYRIGDTTYEVDLQLKTVEEYTYEMVNDADFDSSNIIVFELEDKGISSIGSYEVHCKAINNGRQNIKYISFDMGYFDEDGNLLDKDGRYNDDLVKPGNFATMKSFMMDEEYSHLVGGFGIYSYEYELVEDDDNGFNRYEINLQTKTVEASHVDN